MPVRTNRQKLDGLENKCPNQANLYIYWHNESRSKRSAEPHRGQQKATRKRGFQPATNQVILENEVWKVFGVMGAKRSCSHSLFRGGSPNGCTTTTPLLRFCKARKKIFFIKKRVQATKSQPEASQAKKRRQPRPAHLSVQKTTLLQVS